ncbi:hypothetical protein D9M69_548230 [compost metagenome]
MVCGAGRRVQHPSRCRARDHAAAAQPHERDGVLDHGGAGGRRLPRAARPLPPEELAGQREGKRRDHRALPGRDARDAAVGPCVGGRPRPRDPLGLRRRCRPQEPRALRGTLRLSVGRGLGHDRDRRGRLHHGQPQAAPGWHELLRAAGRFRRDPPHGRGRQRRGHRHARRTARALGRC